MKILVQAKDMKVTKAIENFVSVKVKRTVTKFGQRVLGVKVYLENVARKKNDPAASQAKVEIEIPGNNIVVEEKSFDPYQAISKALKTGGRKLRKMTEKRRKDTRTSNGKNRAN